MYLICQQNCKNMEGFTITYHQTCHVTKVFKIVSLLSTMATYQCFVVCTFQQPLKADRDVKV